MTAPQPIIIEKIHGGGVYNGPLITLDSSGLSSLTHDSLSVAVALARRDVRKRRETEARKEQSEKREPGRVKIIRSREYRERLRKRQNRHPQRLIIKESGCGGVVKTTTTQTGQAVSNTTHLPARSLSPPTRDVMSVPISSGLDLHNRNVKEIDRQRQEILRYLALIKQLEQNSMERCQRELIYAEEIEDEKRRIKRRNERLVRLSRQVYSLNNKLLDIQQDIVRQDSAPDKLTKDRLVGKLAMLHRNTVDTLELFYQQLLDQHRSDIGSVGCPELGHVIRQLSVSVGQLQIIHVTNDRIVQEVDNIQVLNRITSGLSDVYQPVTKETQPTDLRRTFVEKSHVRPAKPARQGHSVVAWEVPVSSVLRTQRPKRPPVRQVTAKPPATQRIERACMVTTTTHYADPTVSSKLKDNVAKPAEHLTKHSAGDKFWKPVSQSKQMKLSLSEQDKTSSLQLMSADREERVDDLLTSVIDYSDVNHLLLRMKQIQVEQDDIRRRWRTIIYDDNNNSHVAVHDADDIITDPKPFTSSDLLSLSDNQSAVQFKGHQPLLFTKQQYNKVLPSGEPSVQHSECQKNTVLALPVSMRHSIEEGRERFAEWLSEQSLTSSGQFNPWILIDSIADEFLENCLHDIVTELELLGTDIIEQMYNAEFVIAPSTLPSPKPSRDSLTSPGPKPFRDPLTSPSTFPDRQYTSSPDHTPSSSPGRYSRGDPLKSPSSSPTKHHTTSHYTTDYTSDVMSSTEQGSLSSHRRSAHTPPTQYTTDQSPSHQQQSDNSSISFDD